VYTIRKRMESLPKEVSRHPILRASKMVESRFEENEYLKFVWGRSAGTMNLNFFRK
jgi:hypothetical protein